MSFAFLWAIRRGLAAGARWFSLRGRWIYAAGALTALVVAFLIFQVRASHKQIIALSSDLRASEGEVKLLQQARAADAASLAEQAKVRTIVITKEAHGRAGTERALRAHPEWASVPVPRDVIDSLHE